MLALLVAGHGRVVPDDVLIDGVWAESPPPRARGALRTYISNLRSEIDGALRREGGGYRLAVEQEDIDSRVFESSVDAARRLITSHPIDAAQRIRASLALWRGLPYSDAAPSLRLEEDARRLTELRVTSVEDAIDAELSLGYDAELVGELEVLCAEHPLRERFRAQLMLALYRAGRQAEALRTYAKTRRYLGEELGIDPSPQLRDLEQRMLEHDPSLLIDVSSRVEMVPATGLGRMVRGYEIREAVASGGTGVVHHGFQPSVGREVAIRVVRSELVNRTSFIARFEAEARLVARLDHPHIIKLYDYWRDPSGAYLVTQWLAGGSLAEWLQRGAPDAEVALRVVHQVGGALAYAHRHGVAHRDVGPANVLIDDEDNAYLSGFRVAEGGADEGHGAEARATDVARDLRALADLASALLLCGEQSDEGLRDLLDRAASDEGAAAFESVEQFLADLGAVTAGPTEDARPAAPVRNPYKGLRAFDETDHADFHGRSRLVAELIDALADHPLVAVVGPSGIGKSSAVRAGLIPALRGGALGGDSDRWLITDATPGRFPFDSVTAALSRVATRWPAHAAEQLAADASGIATLIERTLPPDSTLVLVLDQFEELFTLVADEETRRRFIDDLILVARQQRSRVRVVVTLRADYLDGPLGYPGFGNLIRDGMVVVSAPSHDELVELIRLPAERVGVGWEPGLVDRIVEDVARQPGALPLLQYALTEMFARRDGDTLTLGDYQAAGGVVGALGRRAEELYASLGEPARRVAPDIFLRLVAVEESGREVRRRALRRELNTLGLDTGAVSEVLDRYGEHRLLTFDRDPTTRSPTVEVAHEALLARWSRYKAWVDERREDLVLHDRLAAAVTEWRGADNNPQFFLQDGRLDHLEAWAHETDLGLTHDEQRFLADSRAAQESRDKRRRRVRAAVGTGLVAATLTASIFAGFALDSRRRARRAEQLAISRELAASAIGVVDQDSELSLLLAIEAIEAAPDDDSPPLEAVSALHEAVRSSRSLLTGAWDEQRPTGDVDAVISPDGSLVAATGGADTIQVWDSASGEVLWELTDETGGGWFSHPRFSPDGSVLASAFTRYWTEARRVDGGLATGIYLFDPDDGDIVDVLATTGCDWVAFPMRQAFTPDGTHLIRLVDPPAGDAPDGCFDGQLRLELVDLASSQVTDSIEVFSGQPEGRDVFVWAGVDRARSRLLLFDYSAPVGVTRMIDLDDGSVAWEREGVYGIASQDGSLVALGPVSAAQRSVELVDAETGATVRQLTGHSAEVVDVTFSADGRRAYTAGHDGTARVWDTATGTNLLTLTGDPGGLSRVSVDDQGARLGAAGVDGTSRIWDLTERPLGEGIAVDLGPAQIASRGIDVANGLVGVSTIEGECPSQQMGGAIVDATTGELVHAFEDVRSQVLALTPDGSRLVHQYPITYGPDIPCHEIGEGPLVVRDTTSGAIITELDGLCEWVVPEDCVAPPERPYAEFTQGISVSSDGTLVAASGSSRAVSIWDLSTGAVIATWTVSAPDTPGYVTSVALDPSTAVAAFVIQPSGDEVQITDLEGNPLTDLDLAGNANNSGHLAFSPDGTVLAVGGSRLTVVDGSSWDPRWDLEAHQGGVFHLAFSPDGDRIATTGSDGFVRIWSADDGALLQAIPMGDD